MAPDSAMTAYVNIKSNKRATIISTERCCSDGRLFAGQKGGGCRRNPATDFVPIFDLAADILTFHAVWFSRSVHTYVQHKQLSAAG